MRKYLLAAIGAALVVAAAGGASAQRNSNDGKNRWVSVANNSSFTMEAIYAVASRHRLAKIDSPDLIPNDTIPPGRYLDVNFDLGDGECVLDLRARGSDGRDWIERRFNVCTQKNWNLVN